MELIQKIADGAAKGATAVPKAAVAVCTNDAGIAEVRAEEASAKLEHSERVTDGSFDGDDSINWVRLR